ncbi:MAG: hypothetical protein ACYCYF_07110 [Anaerolineae bacterium]
MATTTALAVKSLFWRYMNQLWTGTADSGSTSTLVDAELIDIASTEFPFPLEGKQLKITSTITDLRRIVKVDKATGTLYPNRVFSSAVSTNTFEVWGNSIDGGQPLTNLLNDVLQVARPVTETELTIVTGQRIYAITSLVTSREDVSNVRVRHLDSAGLLPHRAEPLAWFQVYPAIESGVQVMYLQLDRTLTLDTATTELWVEHRKALTAFTADTSTVDATYAEWLAWEAVLRHALDKMADQADRGRWGELARRASGHVRRYRARFMPDAPLRPMHGHLQVM